MVSALFPTPSAPKVFGGAEIVARRLADELSKRGTQVTVLRAGPPGSTITEEEVGALRVLSIPIRNYYSPFDGRERSSYSKLLWHMRDDLGDSRDVRRVIASVRPDVVHTHNINALSTGVWRAAAYSTPVVHTLHDYYLLCPRTTRFRDGAVCAAPCSDCRLLTLRRRIDTQVIGDVVGVSRGMLQPHLDKGLFSDARQHVIPNIIQPELAAEPHRVGSPVTFGFLGRITIEKGIERLVEAFAKMHGDAQLVFGGHIDDATKARLLALANGRRIAFLGYVAPADFFRSIDVLVVPSIWDDPLPTVILEAQAAGVPAIGSRRGGIPEAIGSDAAGWTYDPDVPHALPDLLGQVVAQRSGIEDRAKAASTAAGRFHADAVTAQYGAVYEMAISGSTVEVAAGGR